MKIDEIVILELASTLVEIYDLTYCEKAKEEAEKALEYLGFSENEAKKAVEMMLKWLDESSGEETN